MAKMSKLSALPVFFDLEGQSVLLAGGSEAAAWKADLLLAGGAHIHLFAETISKDMEALLLHPRLTHFSHSWRSADFGQYRIAVADFDGDDEASAFSTAMRGSGIFANVIDKPNFCAFRFGSIVNRSPVVIGISTDGAAPILGQAIRGRIEAMLPKALSEWASLAARIRTRVTRALPQGPQRRIFWESFVERVFASSAGPTGKDEGRLLERANGIASHPSRGSVTLVGAGPGDPELLTLKAMHALQSADVILFDDTVSAELLEIGRREAKRMLVGKRGGRKSCPQEDINAAMVAFARAGKRVVRLKAGDPSVFGRSGEEIAFLEAAGIPVSVIPGITAASALAAGTNTSLTHRDCAQSVRFITGHSKKGVLPDNIDWRAIADPSATTVFYMGRRTAAEIASRLLAEGVEPETPVVVAANISRADERHWFGTISQLHHGTTVVGSEDPVLIGIGQVFARRPQAVGLALEQVRSIDPPASEDAVTYRAHVIAGSNSLSGPGP